MEWGRTGRRRISGMLPLLAFHAVSEYWRLDRKPPVTAGLLAANTLVYLRPSFLHPILPTIEQVWFNPYLILKQKSLKRFLLSAFYHVGEPHLVYNMMSLLWKGVQLETSMGSLEFASMVATLLCMSQGITLLLAKSLLVFFDYDRAYYREYSVGFSGVLFAMKVVLNSQSNGYANVHGVVVPSRYAAWAELFLIQLLVPKVSFLGHLGGILAGLVYIRLKDSYAGPDPLTRIARWLASLLSLPLRLVGRMGGSRRRHSLWRGAVGGREADLDRLWRCSACTFDNSGRLSVCEMCGTGRDDDDDFTSVGSSGGAGDIPLEELRLRRVQRFER